MKILADLGLQRETIKQVSWKAFIFFQKSSDLFQFGKIGKRILVFDELQILAGFESCSWQYCFRLALKQNYKTGYITQAGHGFKLLIRSVRSGIWGGGVWQPQHCDEVVSRSYLPSSRRLCSSAVNLGAEWVCMDGCCLSETCWCGMLPALAGWQRVISLRVEVSLLPALVLPWRWVVSAVPRSGSFLCLVQNSAVTLDTS